MVIFGVHVHVGIRSAAKVWPLINALLTYHPHLTALSASSPYGSGTDTGYASNRTMLFQQLPTAGLPFQFETWAQYRAYLDDVFTTGVISDASELRWDIRPSLRLGTIEVRACDGFPGLRTSPPSRRSSTASSPTSRTSSTRACGRPFPPWHVQENKWRAARYGLDAIIIRDTDNTEAHVVDDIKELLTGWSRPLGAGCALSSPASRHPGSPGRATSGCARPSTPTAPGTFEPPCARWSWTRPAERPVAAVSAQPSRSPRRSSAVIADGRRRTLVDDRAKGRLPFLEGDDLLLDRVARTRAGRR